MRILLIMLACFLTACASEEMPVSKTRMWLGANKQNLLNEWGKPANIKVQPDGDSIYQYTRTKTRQMSFPTPQQGVMIVGHNQAVGFNTPGSAPQQSVSYCYTDFEITPDDKIKSVEQRGEGCF